MAEVRRALYAEKVKAPGTSRALVKRPVDKLDPEMDDLVNAGEQGFMYLCCDLHNPSAFDYIKAPPLLKPSTTKRSRLDPEQDTTTQAHQELKKNLNDWRDSKTASRYTATLLANIGASLVLPNNTLQRIIKCTKKHIGTIAELQKQTKWYHIGHGYCQPLFSQACRSAYDSGPTAFSSFNIKHSWCKCGAKCSSTHPSTKDEGRYEM
ncbi:hypothetical protein PHLCEN_2v2561 [Hermanssonia centrifuga]|uniref:Uncharacterized protein n=1 Tax=Hermanssonia centrifuga TaxID=98765 RepID=A0A2R6RLJ3_9APHY|nr:hypothetical protein PHLCEN_2v2561 [Hermanssonia centrifuga]